MSDVGRAGALFDRFLRVAISDRSSCPRPLADQVRKLAGTVDAFILRERDLDDESYLELAKPIMEACVECEIAFMAHCHVDAARRLGARIIHIPLPELHRSGRPEGFDLVGTNVHALEEVRLAEEFGVDYLVASPIFTPSCKPIEGRGIGFLRDVVDQTDLPVIALGGIGDTTEPLVRKIAAGAARMSGYMS